MLRPSRLLFLATLALLAGASACRPKATETPQLTEWPIETELLFETIVRGDGGEYEGSTPRVISIASRQDIDRLDGLIGQNVQDRLAEVDFSRYLVIAVFRGHQANAGHDTFIERVTRRGDAVVVYTQFREPRPDQVAEDIATSPYHIIKVPRDEDIGRETELLLQIQMVTPTAPSPE